MILVVCATELELQPLLEQLSPDERRWMSLVSGVGAVETTLALTRFFVKNRERRFDAILHSGVAGAYLAGAGEGAELLDICLAEREVFGDFGICYPERFEPLPTSLGPRSWYELDAPLLGRCASILQEKNIVFRQGTFVTVAGCSATAERGRMLADQYGALCENMEGAAVARVCQEFSVPLFEMRSISNFVEDRKLSRWKLNEACRQAADVAATLVQELIKK